MSLEFAILGFLNYRPYTGYDLKKIFDGSVSHFWPADQSQIYRTLVNLTERSLVEMEIVHQEVRPDRKVYHITDSGREELRTWLCGPFPIVEPRSATLIQIFFSGQLSDDEVLEKFEGFAEILRMLLNRYNQVPGQIGPFQQEITSPREHFFWLLTLENGIISMKATLEWVESIIHRIKSGQIPQDLKNNSDNSTMWSNRR